MKKSILLFLVLFFGGVIKAQTPATYNSAEILLGLKKLKVLGSVLYIAAHPDDENTRLLAYLSKERLYRTGYLSLTRGDGGQNLIGDEQGIELGLIRTQELLAARRIDGAEQFFTRAYDFGFSKSTDEALRIWDKEKIMSDVVWIIRKFQPDVIITRFPPDNRAGHGHHSASAVLGREAFDAAADANRFPEQFKYGVKPWKAKRIMWNTFNFGGANTTSNDQLKIDVGVFNPLLGKSYGEIASESRSQHKSQGFGVPRQRGTQTEFFTLTGGDAMTTDIAEGVIADWSRVEGGAVINQMIDAIVANYSFQNPSASVKSLVELYKAIEKINDGDWKIKKLEEVKNLIEACSGLWLEASTNQPFVVTNDSLRLNFQVINRSNSSLILKQVKVDTCLRPKISNSTNDSLTGIDSLLNFYCIKQESFVDTSLSTSLKINANFSFQRRIVVRQRSVSDPYWLRLPMNSGSFTVNNQLQIGKAENNPVYTAIFFVEVEGTIFEFQKPVNYKFTDPVKGELYQPLAVYPPVSIRPNQSVLIFKDSSSKEVNIHFLSNAGFDQKANITVNTGKNWKMIPDFVQFTVSKNAELDWKLRIKPLKQLNGEAAHIKPNLTPNFGGIYTQKVRKIEYDHIPTITYFPDALSKVVYVDVKTVGKKIGYINGAGDYVPFCLQQMGYSVDLLREQDLTFDKLKQYDAIVTGIRAYNVHAWLSSAYDALMQYVKEGGVLLVQYNTSNQIGPIRSKISPYPFTISRNRVTEEDAKVSFLQPNHPVLNYPNKITEKDFEGWVQERSVYEADNTDSNYVSIFGMNDAGEPQRKGSLLVATYGKGRFIYSAVAFFRQLPAGVPGAYRLMANLLATPGK
jgi:LmbE family N-acetylglucosaminyl deacetylase